MKLWSKGFEPDKMIEQFTVGADRELDMRLARYDVEGSMAHIRMLESIGLLGSDELPVLLDALKDIAAMIERGEFEIGEGIEDVHSQVEFLLTGRSRQEDPFRTLAQRSGARRPQTFHA